ncbi:MAG: hypothetical protein K2X76_13860 [Sphingomonas sp.]|nr:hypothetical protein [Sphingomonas sp.]
MSATPLAHRAALPALLFALVWLSCAWFGSWPFNDNQATRLYAAIALVEEGRASIDDYAPLTIDKARFGDHHYLDKAPGMTLLAAPAVAALGRFDGDRARDHPLSRGDYWFGRYLRSRLWLTTALGSAVLTALGAVALFALARDAIGSTGGGLVAALGYALGTPAWGWSTTLFGHAPVAALYAIAAWAVWRGTQARASPGHALLAGVALGGAVLIEYQAVLAGAVIGLWALWRLRGRDGAGVAILAALAGALPAAAALIGYNLIAFGQPFRIGYAGVVGWDGMRQGLFGLTYPKPLVLLELLIGSRRGLLWVAPVLLLAPAGLAGLIAARRTRDLGVMAAAGAATVLLVNAAYVYWDGGFSTGPRHSLPAVPLLALGLGALWAARPRWRAGIALLLLLSIALNLAIAATDIFAPDDKPFPIWDPVLGVALPAGRFDDWPSVWLYWRPWQGMVLYLTLALPLAALLLVAARLRARPNIYRTDGAA